MIFSTKNKGFTLIELMVAIAIVGILAAIAYPSYVDSVRKARRADAQAALTEVAQKLEAYYAKNATYTTDMQDLGYFSANGNNMPTTVPTNERYYSVSILAAETDCPLNRCYRIAAQPRLDQVNDTVYGYILWSTGRKQRWISSGWQDSWKD